MEVKCEYCGSMIPATAEKCPNCGGTNENMQRSVSGTPRTIEELKSWYAAMNLPPEDVTRFYIGKNVKQARAIGIYKDREEFVVYKNKADGTRAVRYRGKDEAYAVNEVYLKLKSEILNQKSRNVGKGGKGYAQPSGNIMNQIIRFIMKRPYILLFVLFILISACNNMQHRNDGYYLYNNNTYYNYGNSWYYYNTDYNDYFETTEPYFDGSRDDYYQGSYSYDGTDYDFKDSSAWDSIKDSDDDWFSSDSDWSSDSDYGWDSGSDWDWGGSDWDSDW